MNEQLAIDIELNAVLGRECEGVIITLCNAQITVESAHKDIRETSASEEKEMHTERQVRSMCEFDSNSLRNGPGNRGQRCSGHKDRRELERRKQKATSISDKLECDSSQYIH